MRYKEEFEKNKGKGFSVVADTPELQRIKKTQDQISNVRSSASMVPTLTYCPAFSFPPCQAGCREGGTWVGLADGCLSRGKRLGFPATFSLCTPDSPFATLRPRSISAFKGL